jgi:hypothetical protein
MGDKRNLSVEIPEVVLTQIENRAAITSRSRNEEARYLLNIALDDIGMAEAIIPEVAGARKRTVFYLEANQIALIKARATKLQHKVGPEAVRLIIYALKKVTERDLQLIEQMLRMGSAAPAPR